MRASLFRRLNKRPWFNEIKAIFSLWKNSRYTRGLAGLLLHSLICFLMVKIGHKIVESAGLGECAPALQWRHVGSLFSLFSYHLSSLMTFSGFEDFASALRRRA